MDFFSLSGDYQDLQESDAILKSNHFFHALDLNPMGSNILLSTNKVAQLYSFFGVGPC